MHLSGASSFRPSLSRVSESMMFEHRDRLPLRDLPDMAVAVPLAIDRRIGTLVVDDDTAATRIPQVSNSRNAERAFKYGAIRSRMSARRGRQRPVPSLKGPS